MSPKRPPGQELNQESRPGVVIHCVLLPYNIFERPLGCNARTSLIGIPPKVSMHPHIASSMLGAALETLTGPRSKDAVLLVVSEVAPGAAPGTESG